jgi:DNA modification methylase
MGEDALDSQRVCMTPALTREMVSIRDLRPAPYNPRRIDPAAMAGLEKSIDRFGLVQDIVVNRRTMHVVGGHQRLKAIKAKKAKVAPVTWVDLDETEERALNIALNSPHIVGEFTDKLQAILDELAAANLGLFEDLRLGALRTDEIARSFGSDPDEVPPPPYDTPRTKPGDVIRLGQHRLMCGDAADAATITAVLGEDAVELLLTDPPYGVRYSAKSRDAAQRNGGTTAHRDIVNDDRTDYATWFRSWLPIIPWAPYASFYIFMSSQEMHNLRITIDALGWKWHDMLLWVKNRPVLSRKNYNQVYEPIAFGEPPVEAKDVAGIAIFGWPERHRFYGSKSRTNILEFDVATKNDLHPTMKPVALLEQLLRDGSRDGGIVLDPFSGSGSTVIACERLGRVCRAIELDPLYCDVIVARWEAHTGLEARRPGAGC